MVWIHCASLCVHADAGRSKIALRNRPGDIQEVWRIREDGFVREPVDGFHVDMICYSARIRRDAVNRTRRVDWGV
jgi:hypothetical protein